MFDADHPDASNDPGVVQERPSAARRIAHILVAVLVAVVVPLLVVDAMIGRFAVGAMSTGLLLGVIGSKIGGTRRMLYVAPVFGVAAGLGAFTAYDWSWVAVLTVAAAVAGVGSRFGWFPTLLMIPFGATFVVPVPGGEEAVVYGIVATVGVGYAIVLAHRFGAPPVVDGRRRSTPEAIVIAIGFGVVLGASAAIGVALGWTEPYWVPDPILVLILYILIGKRDRIRGKAIGTAVGVAAALVVAILDPPAGVIAALAIVAFIAALTQGKRYWLMYGLATFAIVLALAAPDKIGFEAEQRGVQYLAGIALLVVGLFVLRAIGRWLTRGYPQPELAT